MPRDHPHASCGGGGVQLSLCDTSPLRPYLFCTGRKSLNSGGSSSSEYNLSEK